MTGQVRFYDNGTLLGYDSLHGGLAECGLGTAGRDVNAHWNIARSGGSLS